MDYTHQFGFNFMQWAASDPHGFTTLLAGMWITCEVIVVALVLCVRFLILRLQQDGHGRNQGTTWLAKFNRPQQTIELTPEEVARLRSVNNNV
jgi:hypothetical protein